MVAFSRLANCLSSRLTRLGKADYEGILGKVKTRLLQKFVSKTQTRTLNPEPAKCQLVVVKQFYNVFDVVITLIVCSPARSIAQVTLYRFSNLLFAHLRRKFAVSKNEPTQHKRPPLDRTPVPSKSLAINHGLNTSFHRVFRTGSRRKLVNRSRTGHDRFGRIVLPSHRLGFKGRGRAPVVAPVAEIEVRPRRHFRFLLGPGGQLAGSVYVQLARVFLRRLWTRHGRCHAPSGRAVVLGPKKGPIWLEKQRLEVELGRQSAETAGLNLFCGVLVFLPLGRRMALHLEWIIGDGSEKPTSKYG